MTLPPNATALNAKERKMMKYVDKFSRIFTELYPQRRPLLLKGKNEFGTAKLICTTLRPAQLPGPGGRRLPLHQGQALPRLLGLSPNRCQPGGCL